MIGEYVKAASESRARELEAAINRYRDCGVEIERFSIHEHPDRTELCIDDVPRFTWRLVFPTTIPSSPPSLQGKLNVRL
jgi:hypothetical protein